TFICEVTGSTNVTEIEKLTFHYRENTLSFRVNAMEYSAPKYNKVAYKMENLDEHEVKINSGRLIRYANMPPGHYQFLVYAYNSDGIRNPVPHRLALYITPPFYKTISFMALVILASGGILAYIIYLRFSKTLELQRVRLKLYENLHDDVGSRLTAIVLSAEELERQDQIHNPKLQAIAQIAKSIVGNMRRLVWAIDPENDKVINIMQKINHDRSQILPDQVRFQIEVDESIKQAVVPGEIRYQISSICNEALNNIAKYAEATEVTVRISKEKNLFKLLISDNGKGFDPDSKNKNVTAGSGYGLNNMRRRASRVKGNLEIWSRPGQGTRIEATFPV
ncbi:MAG TPA: ATP-binding protein, partial [Saprospiraceae bacterium]|nr:ATP-binding protein [Saprospiraceae bacterium]